MQSKVLKAFEKLINVDPNLSGVGQSVLGQGMLLKEGRCVFSIASLYYWINVSEEVEMSEFRSQLYSGFLNRDLRCLGYRIEVNHSTGHVDSSFYQLVKL